VNETAGTTNGNGHERIGEQLPDFRAPSNHGQTLERASFVGKVGMVVFVPSGGTLREPELDEWDEHLVDFGHLRVQVLGVLRTTAKTLREESEEAARGVTLLADEDGRIGAALAAGAAPVPTLIADRTGTIVDVVDRDESTGHVVEVLRRVESLHDRLDAMRPDV
jgi:peroxiredoxin